MYSNASITLPYLARILVVYLATVGMSHAAGWNFVPSLTIAETYFEYDQPEPDGNQSELLTELRPGVSMAKRVGKNEMALDYNLRVLQESNTETNDSSALHEFKVKSVTNYLQDGLRVEANVERTLHHRFDEDGVSVEFTANKTDVTEVTYTRVNPTYTKNLGSDTKLLLVHSSLYTDYSRGKIGTTNYYSQRNVAKLSNASPRRKFSWALNYKDLNNSADEVAIGTNEYSLELGYSLFRRGTVFYRVGENETTFWNAGIKLFPSRRSQMEYFVGNKFNAETKGALVKLGSKRWEFEAKYFEEIEDRTLASAPSEPLFENPIIEDFYTGLFFQKAGEARVLYKGRRFNFVLKVEKRRRFEAADLETVGTKEVGDLYSAECVVTYRLGDRFSFNVKVGESTLDLSQVDVERRAKTGSVELQQKLGRVMGARYGFARNISSVSGDTETEFEENSVHVKVVFQFI